MNFKENQLKKVAYIEKILEQYNVTISRLAYGLPMGAQLDYADELTLTRAFEGRKIIRKE